ncbi:MAG: TonB-dependent receptor [Cytophagales bacterium]|nr:TonB-dependent receptor [Cytophagales bacterium]MDW8383389.1 TonB-dependent receptor [Flammeovirgaceae bacterium]
MRVFFLHLFALFFSYKALSQSTQTIKGRIVDKLTQQPLIGANVVWMLNDSLIGGGATTDENGFFRIENVALGRRTVRVTMVGYETQLITNLLVTSAKEINLEIQLIESGTELQSVEIIAYEKNETINDMVAVSGRTFALEETERYPASRQDPARMASNFAGVQGSNDARNDIVIRGNSPVGLLWRLEDIDIPNPNHFAVAGTTGGPISIINNKYLANSDFMTGAFPAEYGNALAGVFDLRMRNGNPEKHEFTGQIGFLGTEFACEGPLHKNKRISYLATYRYSTFQLLNAMTLPLGTNAVPRYQDAAFRINIPETKAGKFAVFGIGGISAIDIVLSQFDKPVRELYGINNRDQYFRTGMFTVGTSHQVNIGKNGFLRTVIAQSAQRIGSHHDLIYRDSTFKATLIAPVLKYRALEHRSQITTYLNHKIGKHYFKGGISFINIRYIFDDKSRNDTSQVFVTRANDDVYAQLIQPFVQLKIRVTDRLTGHLGLRYQLYTLNNSQALDPRAGIVWKPHAKHTWSAGFGIHSQIQQSHILLARFYEPVLQTFGQHNRHLGFSRSNHFIIGYEYVIRKDLRFKTEVYYQYLWNIPVDQTVLSSVSLLNQGASFTRFFPLNKMHNKGTGENYGIEFTFEKFFSKNYFLLITHSLYNSTYRGSNGIKKNTDYNGHYASNILGGWEKALGTSKTNIVTLGTKLTFAGGRRYTPIDRAATIANNGEIVLIDSLRNTKQFHDYFRWDIRLAWKKNAKKFTHEIVLDLLNILNTKNLLDFTYAPNPTDPNDDPLKPQYQLGFLPLLYYKVDF